jgi:hypothetical protein
MSLLQQHLQQHFNASEVGELDLHVRFDWQSGCVDAHIGSGTLSWLDADASAETDPELTLFFSDEQCALDIFNGRRSPIDAFMHSDFRSSGYIIWTFALLRVFAAPVSQATEQSASETDQA